MRCTIKKIRNTTIPNISIKKDDKSPLPKGEYYSEFGIRLNEKTITCSRKFEIR